MAKTENSGLGPLEVRTQYPVTLPVLALYPENTATIGEHKIYMSYSLTIGNTFINTQGFRSYITGEPAITATQVQQGLIESDFYDPDIEGSTADRVTKGFRLYIDVESQRQLIRFKYGLTEDLEWSVEVPYISFDGGSFDETIENFHELVGIDNSASSGGYRTASPRNRYDYYVVKDGQFVINNTQPFSNVQGDVVTGFKWRLWEGGGVIPAASLKFSYKFGTPATQDGQELVSSETPNWGSYLLLSKGFNEWIVYLGEGVSIIGDNGVFAQNLFHRFMAMEYRIDPESSFLIQTMSQSSIFPRSVSANPRGSFQDGSSFSLSSSTDVLVLGYKAWFGSFMFETGMIEDYNQGGQETDIVFYTELGIKW
ncbi:MAG: DUF3187 family protein [SAR324 cluster bacterium]|nr:DUF3187 family protein [SAR324 cluster bacterium]